MRIITRADFVSSDSEAVVDGALSLCLQTTSCFVFLIQHKIKKYPERFCRGQNCQAFILTGQCWCWRKKKKKTFVVSI